MSAYRHRLGEFHLHFSPQSAHLASELQHAHPQVLAAHASWHVKEQVLERSMRTGEKLGMSVCRFSSDDVSHDLRRPFGNFCRTSTGLRVGQGRRSASSEPAQPRQRHHRRPLLSRSQPCRHSRLPRPPAKAVGSSQVGSEYVRDALL